MFVCGGVGGGGGRQKEREKEWGEGGGAQEVSVSSCVRACVHGAHILLARLVLLLLDLISFGLMF